MLREPDSTTQVDDDLAHVPGLTLDQRLDDIQREVRAQGISIRSTARGFSIYAMMALLLSGAMLIAVAFKLDKATPAAPAATGPVAAVPMPNANRAAPAALPKRLTEKLTEMKITGGASTVAAGKVTFAVTNAGTVAHEMVVLKTPTAAGKLATSSSGRADESGNVGETGDMQVGATKTLTLNLKPGHYALICNLPGHYTAGMYTDLTVR
jgi:uncharacterized cupredoxin-like copper-binding protein